MSSQSEFRHLACSVLLGTIESSEFNHTVKKEGLVDFLKQEGLGPLLHFQLARLGYSSLLPAHLRMRLKKDYVGQCLIEDLRHEGSRPIFEKFREQEIPCLAIKGTALAYSIYPEPQLRMRGDTDLFIPAQNRSSVDAILRGHNCRPDNRLPGQFSQYQWSYRRSLAPGAELIFDLHWKISNVEIVSRFLDFDEIWDRSILIERLGIRIPCHLDSLLLACVHRVAHHNSSRALLWLYDIHLLVSSLGPEALDRFQRLARKHAVEGLCRDGIGITLEAFPSEPTQYLSDTFARSPGQKEKSQALLGDYEAIDMLWSDFRNLSGLRPRVRWMREQLFPPLSYMRKRYGQDSFSALCKLYVKRIWKGAWGFFKARMGR